MTSFVISDGYKVRRAWVKRRDVFTVVSAKINSSFCVTKCNITSSFKSVRFNVENASFYVTKCNITSSFKSVRFNVENAIVSKLYHFHDKSNLYDYSIIHEGSRVKSVISNQIGIVTKKELIEVPGIPPTTFITVRWSNGDISHPYPHQLGVELIGSKQK